MDEHGPGIGVCNNSRVPRASLERKAYIQSPEIREWVSVLKCISASGQFIRPLVIFKDKDVRTSWFTEGNIPGWLIATSSWGWAAHCIALRWLKETPLSEPEHTLPSGRQAPQLLILDGHGSHVSVGFMWEGKQNNVKLLFLPVHFSNALQLLGLGTFSPFKSRYRKEIAAFACLGDAAPVKERRFVQCYQKAHAETFNSRLRHSGWVAAGLYPWSLSKGLNRLRFVSPQISASSNTPSTFSDTQTSQKRQS